MEENKKKGIPLVVVVLILVIVITGIVYVVSYKTKQDTLTQKTNTTNTVTTQNKTTLK